MANESAAVYAPVETAARSEGLRLPYVDGLRGASAIYVVLFHMYQFASARFVGAPPKWWKAFTIFNYGDCGVAVFIVLSGYCLMLPVALSDGLQLKGGRRQFALRRLRRLGPGYVAALFGSSVLILLIPPLRHHSGTLWDATLPAFSVGTILAHVLLIYNWSRTWRYEIDTPMWTVALEVQIYAVFVLALLPLWRRTVGRRPHLVILGASAFVTGILMAVGLTWAQPQMLVLFAFGMCAAHMGQLPSRRMRGRVDIIVIAAAASVPLMLATERRFVRDYDFVVLWRELVVGIAVAVLLLALRRATPADGRITGWVGSVFSTRPLTWLGEISYSLYLVHFPIIGAIAFTRVYGRRLGAPENFALIVLVGGALSVAVAVAFHWLFERRYLSRRQPVLSA